MHLVGTQDAVHILTDRLKQGIALAELIAVLALAP